jgi:vitamin B12 transporter
MEKNNGKNKIKTLFFFISFFVLEYEVEKSFFIKGMKSLYFYILSFIICNYAFAQVFSSKDTVFRTEEINVISNRIETNIFWSPTSVKIIDEKQITSSNGERISDVLKTSNNVFVKSYGSNASLNTISLNGLGAEHTLILIDGMKMNSFQNSQFDLSLIPKDKVEKVEIMNNGGSSLYGSNAIGGVLNVITKNSMNVKQFAKVLAEYGSYKYSKYSINYTSSLGNLNYDLLYSYEKSNDNFKYYYDNGENIIEKERTNNNFNDDNLFLNLCYKINKKSELKYNSNYYAQVRTVPGIEAGTPPSSAEQKDLNWNNSLSYKLNLNNDISVSSDMNFQNNLMKYKDPYSEGSFYKNRVLSNNTFVSYKLSSLKNTTGFEILYADINGSSFNNTISREQYSVFDASEIDFKNKIKFYPSIRYDYISDISKNVVTAKFGVNYKPFKSENLNLRSSIGNNFSAPTFNELYWQTIGNPNLKPEKSVNFDAGVIYRFNFIFENTLEFNYTRINIDDKIVWKPAEYGFWRPFNIDKSESNICSIDVKMKKTVSKDIQLGLSYNYTYNKSTKESSDYDGDLSYGKQIFYIPIELSRINIEAGYKNISLNLYYSFTGKRYSDFENKIQLPVIDLVDGNAGYTFEIYKIKLNTKLEVNNIFNEDYQVMTGYPMPLRNYKILLSLIY